MQFSLRFAFLLPFFSVVTTQESICHPMVCVIQAQLPGFRIIGRICTEKKQPAEEEPEDSVSASSEYGWVMGSGFFSDPTTLEFFWHCF